MELAVGIAPSSEPFRIYMEIAGSSVTFGTYISTKLQEAQYRKAITVRTSKLTIPTYFTTKSFSINKNFDNVTRCDHAYLGQEDNSQPLEETIHTAGFHRVNLDRI
jgi:hypothetical protein